jgi:hypothetical protein
VLSFLLMIALTALVTSTGLGFAGMAPSAFDMFVQGFSRYVESQADVTAIQSWLGTLDQNEYTDEHGGTTERRFVGSELPACIAGLHPKWAVVLPDNAGHLMARLLWGGGFIGHWGIIVGDKTMESPAISEIIGYQPLAPGAWIWYELN